MHLVHPSVAVTSYGLTTLTLSPFHCKCKVSQKACLPVPRGASARIWEALWLAGGHCAEALCIHQIRWVRALRRTVWSTPACLSYRLFLS